MMAAVVAFLSIVGSQAQAGCSCATDRVTDGNTNGTNNLTTALTGNTVCVAKSGGGWENQEQHRNDTSLWDYKLGLNHPVDPTTQLGTWSIGNSEVTYYYYGRAPSTYSVCSSVKKPGNGSVIGFCPSATGASTIDATIKGGATPTTSC